METLLFKNPTIFQGSILDYILNFILQLISFLYINDEYIL